MFFGRYFRHLLMGFKVNQMKKPFRQSQHLARKLGGGVFEYNHLMRGHRKNMQNKIDELYNRIERDPRRKEWLLLYLIYFSAIGAHMVEKADRWLNTWADSMRGLGFPEIADSYLQLAPKEANHHQWHREDVHKLCQIYKDKFGRELNVETIFEKAKVACVERYYEFSEKIVEDEKVYLSLAELYETEIMALYHAPELIGYCLAELGPEMMNDLGFFRDHTGTDIERIRGDITQINDYLTKQPNHLAQLENAGRATIDFYLEYFNEAVELAWRELQTSSRARQKAA